MGFEKLAERAIREAMQEGKFDRLPNSGQPLDLEDYFKVPEELRAAYGLLKSASILPEEAQLLKDVARLENEIASAGDSPEQQMWRGSLHATQLRLAVLMERRRCAGRI